MKHSDIQEILDFFSPSPCMLQLICILMRLLVSSLITCRRRKAASSHEKVSEVLPASINSRPIAKNLITWVNSCVRTKRNTALIEKIYYCNG